MTSRMSYLVFGAAIAVLGLLALVTGSANLRPQPLRAAAAVASSGAVPGVKQPPLRTYHVDYARGDDAADGLSPAAAWKHAPGDPAATAKPGAFVPRPGDRILLAAGVRYHGSIVAPWQGTAANPIVIEGAGADRAAIMDGSDWSAEVRPCSGAAECGNAPDWQGLSMARFAEALPPDAVVAQGNALLTSAQWPDPADPFYADEIETFAKAAGEDLNAGSVALPAELPAGLSDAAELRIAIWATHNTVRERPVDAIGNGRLTFAPGKVRTYTDRTSRFALRGHPALISRPGEYAMLADRRTVVFKPGPGGANRVVASAGRSGIDLAEAAHVVVRGISFENFADAGRRIRSGVPILAMRKGASDILVADNRFANLTLRQSTGAITFWDSARITISGNTITTVAEGSAIRVLRTAGLTVKDNDISRLGRTGLMMMGVTDALIEGNRIYDILGVHGNGLSAYNYNERIRVTGNSIWRAKQPVTTHGNSKPGNVARDLVFDRNLLVAVDDALGSFISWGNSQEVALIGNIILGGDKGAVRLKKSDTGLRITGNVTDGIIYAAPWPADWTVKDNAYRRLAVFQKKYHPTEEVSIRDVTANGEPPRDLARYCDLLAVPDDRSQAIGADFTCGG